MAEERKGLFAKMRGMRERAARNAMPTPGVDMSRAGQPGGGLTDEQVRLMQEGKFGKPEAGVPVRERQPAPAAKAAPAPSVPTDMHRPALFAEKNGKIRFSPAVDPYVYEYDPQTQTYTIVAGPTGVGATFGPDHPAISKFDASREEALQQAGPAGAPAEETPARRDAQEAEGEPGEFEDIVPPMSADDPFGARAGFSLREGGVDNPFLRNPMKESFAPSTKPQRAPIPTQARAKADAAADAAEDEEMAAMRRILGF